MLEIKTIEKEVVRAEKISVRQCVLREPELVKLIADYLKQQGETVTEVKWIVHVHTDYDPHTGEGAQTSVFDSVEVTLADG